MTILITGATGFVGQHLLERLAGSEHTVRCLVRPSSDLTGIAESGTETAVGDVTDAASVMAAIEGCDRVIHLANLYSFWEPDDDVYNTVNVEGTRNVMEAAIAAGVSKMIHVSSVVVYGRQDKVPFSEECPPGPLPSVYAKTKLAGDRTVWELAAKTQLAVVMLFPGGVLGPGDEKSSGRYIMDLLERRMPARVMENSVMTWVDVRDVVEAIVKAMEKAGNEGEKYIVGNHRLTFGQLNELVRDISGVRLPRLRMPRLLLKPNALLLTALANLIQRPPLWGMAADAIATLSHGIAANGEKAQRDLGVRYRPIRETLEDAIAWYRSPSRV